MIIGMRDGRIVSHGMPVEILTRVRLAEIFGYEMRVEAVDVGRPFALHHI